ncbi:MAG: HAD hydrolase family protein [Calditrichia bacterium]|nr:HAD hydrolase family protein [Calditrichia bacterium]
MTKNINEVLTKKISLIKLIILDVDGTMTNGKISYSINGSDIKQFDVHDGFGIKLLQDADIRIAIVSSKSSVTIEKRFRELDIEDKYLGISNKLIVYKTLKEKYELTDKQIACVGDDIPDIPILKYVGFAVGVNNAVDEVKQIVDYVTHRDGGFGAIREVAELILKTKGVYQTIIDNKIKAWEKEAGM